MNGLSDRSIRKIKSNIEQGIRTIIVEGASDKCVYQRFYPDANFVYGESAHAIIEKMRQFNGEFEKTPLVVAIIDKDMMTDEEIESLLTENIYTLNIREIESIFLREDVIKSLFGDRLFQKFSSKVKSVASTETLHDVNNFEEALQMLKKRVSSKYNIRLLLKEIDVRNMGNNSNIEYLCQMMDRKNVWGLVSDLIPKLERIR